MLDTPNKIANRHIVLFDNDSTPWDFVVDLLVSVLGKSTQEAEALAAKAHEEGRTICGSWPAPLADQMLETMRARIAEAEYRLRIETSPFGSDRPESETICSFCAEPVDRHTAYPGKTALICKECLAVGATSLSQVASSRGFKHAQEAVRWHFAGLPKDQIVATARQFPGHMRADVQIAIDRLFASPVRFFGVHERQRYETLTFAALTTHGSQAAAIAPVQYHDVDVGEAAPVKCLNNGLWLCQESELRFAVLLSMHREFNQESGIHIEIAVPSGEAGSALVQRCFKELEAAVDSARSYRGKVLSLDSEDDYRGRSRGMMVHRLPLVRREEVILPEATLAVLDRNVLRFIESREGLRARGLSTRKGILLYGPPGTGKTHTIRYLANNLPGHTTLIITAGQMGLLGAYMALARLLQPTLVVIEDVDLIARDREAMQGPCEESLLNRLLNEMDGLRDNADIIFVLTTNRPEQLEGALAGRPGRIDQAIEVPLPDDIGREKLVRLYGAGLDLSDDVVREAVIRTRGVTASFIKELMRRTAQASMARDASSRALSSDVVDALADMLFTGGSLNLKLLGGAGADIEQAVG